MALARLTALGSVVVAIALASLVPGFDAAGAPVPPTAALLGWLGVAALVLGLAVGESVGITVASVAFVMRIGMTATAAGPLVPPVWMQAFILVVCIELAAVSMEQRTRPRSTGAILGRLALSALTAVTVALVMESAVYGTSGGGMLLRIGAVAAMVLVMGWITVLWIRAVEQTGDGSVEGLG